MSGFNFTKENINEGLFGFLKDNSVNDKRDELLKEILTTSDTRTSKSSYNNPLNNTKKYTQTIKVSEKKMTLEDVEKMSKDEKEDMWNKLVDNGVENLTEEDKKILQLLSK
jgi:hypothetical protein